MALTGFQMSPAVGHTGDGPLYTMWVPYPLKATCRGGRRRGTGAAGEGMPGTRGQTGQTGGLQMRLRARALLQRRTAQRNV